MSDSESAEEFGSAKDEKYNESEKSGAESDSDAPLSKSKSTPKKKTTKSPKKKTVKKEKKGKKKAGRPAKKEKPGKVSFSLDPLAGAEPADENDDEEEEYEVEAIVGHREYNGKLVYKIRWKGYEAIHDTWESYDSLSCPDLLEMYNTKHNVKIPSRAKKRKSGAGKSKRTPKKRRSSISDESDEEPWEGDGDSEDEYEVEKIIDMRSKKNGTREFLVHWKRWSSEHDTWEPEANLSCPEIIDRFLNRIEHAKTNFKELRVGRKHTERFTLNTNDSGRRLSKRNNNKQRVSYFDAEGEDE